jgi:predicted Zn-dependent protease
MKKSFIFFTALCILGSSCAVNPVTGKKGVILVSKDQEKAMGAEADPSIVNEYGLYSDPTMQAFINEKGKQMGKISHMPDLEYNFKILDSPIVNAFALPGGFVYFTRGIMAHFNNEAEFAGVLGHEIGHVTARHSASQQTKQILAQVGLIGAMVVSPTLAQFGEQAMQGLSLLFLKYSRDNESESDKLGVTYSTEIGYDSYEMAHFFNTLNALSGGEEGRLPVFMSTHPDPGDRYKKVTMHTEDVHAAKGIKRADLAINRDQYLKMIDNIIVGDDPKAGYFEENYFYHPELKFQFVAPDGWQKQNSPSQIAMAPKDGKGLLLMKIAAGSSPDQAAQTFITENKLVVEDKSTRPVNGLPAVALAGTVTQPGQNGQPGQQLRITTYFIQYNNLIYNFIGVSAAADFNSYYNIFNQTMSSFKPLTDQTKINKQPDRLKIVSANRNATLKDILRDNGQAESRMQELAILNGMELTAPVIAGSKVKTLINNGVPSK